MILYKALRILVLIIFKIIFPMEIYGDRELASFNNVVICSNHWSNWDPIFLSVVFKKPIYWLAKIELFKNPIVGSFLRLVGAIPIDRDNIDLQAMKNAMRVLKNGNILGVFVEGTRVDEVDYNNAKAGAIVIGLKTNSPLIPVYIGSDYKFFRKTKVIIGKEFTIKSGNSKKLTNSDYEKLSYNLLKHIYYLGGVNND